MYLFTAKMPDRPASGIVRLGLETQGEAELYRSLALLRTGAWANVEFWPDSPPAPNLEHQRRG